MRTNMKVTKEALEDKIIVYVDMDGTMVDFSSAYKARRQENPLVGYPQSEYGFFENLKPFPDMVETMKAMQADIRYEVFILTAPSEKNPLCYTEKRNSIEKLLGFEWLERLIIAPYKGLMIGDYLIDDMTGKGQEDFLGHHVHYGRGEIKNWTDVREFFDV